MEGDVPSRDEELDAFIAAASRMLGITIEPEWRGQVRVWLAATNAASELVEALPLDDEAEPATVFEA